MNSLTLLAHVGGRMGDPDDVGWVILGLVLVGVTLLIIAFVLYSALHFARILLQSWREDRQIARREANTVRVQKRRARQTESGMHSPELRNTARINPTLGPQPPHAPSRKRPKDRWGTGASERPRQPYDRSVTGRWEMPRFAKLSLHFGTPAGTGLRSSRAWIPS